MKHSTDNPAGNAPDLWEDNGHELKLFVPREFGFAENLSYLSKSPNERMYRIKEGRIYRALSIGQETPVIEISADKDNTIIIRFLGDRGPSASSLREEVARYVRDWFDLDTDLRPFYELAQTDPLLRGPVAKFYGLRNIGIPDLFEAICWAIIGQQINLAFAYTLKQRFVENFSRRIECEGEPYWIFPTPHDIAGLSVQDLAELRMSIKKCEYIVGVAKLMAEGRLTKEALESADDHQAAEKMLVEIRGIGPWTANYVLMRCLRCPSAFPLADVGLHNAIKHVLGWERKPTGAEILQLASNWTGWEAYATFYLWRVLD